MKLRLCASTLIYLWLAGCETAPVNPIAVEPAAADPSPHAALNERISHYAALYDVPESLIHRSIQQESGYNPAARHGPFWGLMQLRLETARALGYQGPAQGLLDADTNLKYGAAYLSNAYLVAGGDPDRAMALYVSGYYFEARRKGLLDRLRKAD
jgi:soluble lytic murein transglycosylase-like protein